MEESKAILGQGGEKPSVSQRVVREGGIYGGA